MSGTGYDVTVTSPTYRWLGSSLEQHQPPVLAVLVGKNVEEAKVAPQESSVKFVERIRSESREMDIVVLFFEKNKGLWKDVPAEKIGTLPYKVDGVLTCNYFNAVRCFDTDDEQRAFLKTIGLAIDEQFVGC